MKDTVNDRIKYVMGSFGYRSIRAFATKIGIAPTSLNDVIKNGAEPKFSTLSKILAAEPLFSAEWLLRGNGSLRLNNKEIPSTMIDTFSGQLENLEKDVVAAKEQLAEMKEKLLIMQGENEYLRSHLAIKDNSVQGAG